MKLDFSFAINRVWIGLYCETQSIGSFYRLCCRSQCHPRRLSDDLHGIFDPCRYIDAEVSTFVTDGEYRLANHRPALHEGQTAHMHTTVTCSHEHQNLSVNLDLWRSDADGTGLGILSYHLGLPAVIGNTLHLSIAIPSFDSVIYGNGSARSHHNILHLLEMDLQRSVLVHSNHGAVLQSEINSIFVESDVGKYCIRDVSILARSTVLTGSLAKACPCHSLVVRYVPVASVDPELRGDAVLAVLARLAVLTVFAVDSVASDRSVHSVLSILAVFSVLTVLSILSGCTDLVALVVKEPLAVKSPVPVAVCVLSHADHGNSSVCSV